MGFASGFRTGLATGDRRSMMPIVQGLGSMIDRIERRNKKGSVRFGGSSGPSSYEKYTARKDQEELAAEEKRRYESEQEQLKQREAQATDLAAEQKGKQEEQAAITEQRAAETHESTMASQAQQREKAAGMFERSEKKEKRIEAYRGFIQGIQSRNKALTEASWAALAPDMPKKEAKEWAPIKNEMVEVEDPQTGEVTQHRKFTVGRDPGGEESENAMPAPAVTYNDDDSIMVEWPGQAEPQMYANAEEFAKNVGYPMNPEFEKKKGADKDKKKEGKENVKNKLKFANEDIKALDKRWENEDPDLTSEGYKEERKTLIAKRNDLRAEMTGGKPKEKKTAVAKAEGNYKKDPRSGKMGYAGEEPPPDEGARRRKDGIWFRPKEGGGWEIVTEQETGIALAKSH